MRQREATEDPCKVEEDSTVGPPAPLDDATAGQLARIFKALSDPTRVRIIAALLGGERCVHVLTAALGMSQSAVSHQLATLRELRVVRAAKEGRHVYYTLDDAHIHDLFQQALDHLQHQ